MPREGLRSRSSSVAGAAKEAPPPAKPTRRVSGRKRKSEETDENEDPQHKEAPPTKSTRRVSGRKRKSEEKEEKDENIVIKLSEPERIKQKAKFEAMLEEYDLEVEKKVRSLRSQVEDSVLSIRHALQVEMMRLPLNVRKMKVREFKAKYGATEPVVSNKPLPGLPSKSNLFTKIDGSKLDLSSIPVSEFASKAQRDVLSKLNSAFSEMQSFSIV
eukprot:Phypoly_transcript_19454.p1 GENE.Phypoly_transcript_19454~~Phypoly_transcript_19454.p1  ORF type:complete len:215 (+),score=31.86 Phypoly_transcript_19454:52-696(+)